MSTVGILVVLGVLFAIAYLNYRFAPSKALQIGVYAVLAIIALFFLANLSGMSLR